jgi:hypothetical protein
VPEYDAFGREIGEDTLAGLGGGEEPARAARAPQVAPPEPARATFKAPAAGAPVARIRRRSGVGCLVALIALTAFAAVPIVALVGVVRSVEDTFDSPRFDPPSVPAPVVPEPPAEPPTGISGRSMVARGNFGKALARLDGMGRVTSIRLSPDRVDAQFVKGSRQRSAEVGFEGELSRGPATAGGSGVATIALSQIDRAAPSRLVRGSAARFGVREKGIDYLVLMPWPGEGHRWVAYFKNGTYVQGDRNGKVVRRIS